MADVLVGEGKRVQSRTLITDTQRIEWPRKGKHSATMRDRWRLINGSDLYDIEADPGQKVNVSADHPDVVGELNADYEKWWDDIAPSFERTPRIVLCSEDEPVTLLHAHDMHMDEGFGGVPWNQQMIRKGTKSMGWFDVHAPSDGRYRFELYRWPPHTSHNLEEGLPAAAVEPNSTMTTRPAGASLEIVHATLQVDDEVMSEPAVGSERSVAFESTLESGDHQLRISFAEADGVAFVPYYTLIKKLD